MNLLVVLNQALPIFLLIGLGILLRRTGLLRTDAVDALKMLVVRAVLPAVLFPSFLDMELRPDFAWVFVLVFALCVGGWFAGRIITRALGIRRRYAPFLMTGYEYGMLGISLFAGAYGLSAVGVIAVTALGHEIFIWFVFFTLLMIERDGKAGVGATVRGFLLNPVIVAILGGIALNLLGVHTATLQPLPVVGAFMRALGFLAPLTVPLILIVVGHGMIVERDGLSEALKVTLARLVLQGVAAWVAAVGVLGGLLGLDLRYQVALATLMILPPPFIVPLFMPNDAEATAERPLIMQVLTVHTLASLVVFAGIIAVFPTFG